MREEQGQAIQALTLANYLRLAWADLDAARVLSSSNHRNTAHLCEQAAEKLIAGVLVSEGISASISQKLTKIVKNIPDENPLKSALTSMARLEIYATSFRYPTSNGKIRPQPTQAEVSEYLEVIGATLEEAARRLGVELDDTTPASRPGPIRG